jgi:hypothetical protein
MKNDLVCQGVSIAIYDGKKLLSDYLLKQLQKWAYKDERAFAKAGKEVKYEESCLCGSSGGECLP